MNAAARLLTTGQIARAVGVSIQVVIRACDDGEMPCCRIGRNKRHRRVLQSDAERWARKNGYPWELNGRSKSP